MSQGICLEKLPEDLQQELLPKHIAVIMDGNGRWAKKKGLPRIAGHRRGASTLKELLRCCKDWGIPALTAYAFSTENWGRPAGEVDFLMSLFEGKLRQELREMVDEDVQIQFMGNLFTVATNYGGRQEIVQACRAIATQVKEGKLQPEEIDEVLFKRYLYTADVCDPDLLIRTSGEMRLSNFLLWQMAYSEIYITETLWPDFDRSEFHRALSDYQKRSRRFGKV